MPARWLGCNCLENRMMHARATWTAAFLPAVLFLASHSTATAQDAPPPASQPTTAPADRTPIKFKVIEVKGDANWAPLDGNDWKPVKEGDEYPEQTKIRTGLRSSVKLQIGDEEPYSCMAIDSAGKTILTEA